MGSTSEKLTSGPAQGTRGDVYVGPRPFKTGEKLFGRDREAVELLNLLVAERIVLLHSPSGAGKSSLVQAELLPRMIKKGFLVPTMLDEEGHERPVVIRVNIHAQGALASVNRYILSTLLSLEQHRPTTERRPAEALAHIQLNDYLAQEFPALPPEGDGRRGRPLLLVFDQFEEVLTLDRTDRRQKEEFFTALGLALQDRTRWALIAARDDHVAAFDPFRRLIPTALETAYRLDFLRPESARLAILKPAEREGVEFEPTLVDELVDDLRRVQAPGPDGTPESKVGPFVEPVHLQVVCRRLWQERGDATTITRDHLKAVRGVQGEGVDGVLAEYYAERVAAAAQTGGINERHVRDWFGNQLIVAGIRRPVLRGDEAAFGLNPECLGVLDRAFLIRAEDRTGGVWYELAHDRLIGPVLRSNEEYRRAHVNRFQLQAELWEKGNHSDDLLVRGELLAEGERWDAATPDADKTPAEKDFLKRCQEVVAREAAEERQEDRNFLIKLGLGSLAALIACASLIGFLTYRQRVEFNRKQADAKAAFILKAAQEKTALEKEALDRKRREEEISRKRAEVREQVLSTQAKVQPDRASAVRDALGIIDLAEASPRVNQTEADELLRMTMADAAWEALPSPPPASSKRKVPRPEEDPVTSAAFSADGRRLAVGRRHGSVAVWTLNDQDRPITHKLREGGDAEVSALAFTPNGGRLAIGFGDGRFVIIDPAAPEDPVPKFDSLNSGDTRKDAGAELVRHRSAIREIIFSSDGRWFVTAGLDGTNILWSGNGFKQVADVSRVVVSQKLATAMRKVNFMDMSRFRWGSVTSLAFTPYPKRMFFGSSDGRIYSMDLMTTAPTIEPDRDLEEPRPVVALAIHPKARMLVVAMSGGSTGFQKMEMDPNTKSVRPGSEVVGPSDPGAQSGKSLEVGSVASLAFDDHGEWLVARTLDRRIQLWKVDDTHRKLARQAIFPGRDAPLQSVRFEPVHPTDRKTRWLLGDSGDGTVLLWDLNAPGDVPLALRGHKGPLTVMAMSPRGKRLLTACFDGTARLWDMENLPGPMPKAEPRVFAHEAPLLHGAFSSRGDRFATFTEAGGVRYVDLASAASHSLLREARPKYQEYLTARVGFHAQSLALIAGSHLEGPFTAGRWTIGRQGFEDLKPTLFDKFFPKMMLIEQQFLGSGFTFSADGRWLALKGGSRKPGLIDMEDLKNAEPLVAPDDGPVEPASRSLALDRDGRHLVAVRSGGLEVWEVRPGAGRPALTKSDQVPHNQSQGEGRLGPEAITSIACGDGARWIAMADATGTVRLWDRSNADARRKPPALMPGHGEPVSALAFAPESAGTIRLVCGGDDGAIRVWDVRTSTPAEGDRGAGTPLSDDATSTVVALKGHDGPITSVSVSPDGKLLLSTSRDGTARVWTLDRAELRKRAELFRVAPQGAGSSSGN